jgi:hypothetical protein
MNMVWTVRAVILALRSSADFHPLTLRGAHHLDEQIYGEILWKRMEDFPEREAFP